MRRLIVLVEGQTEEAFVKRVLAPHLAGFGVAASATIVGRQRARQRGHARRGGGHYGRWRRDMEHILKEQKDPGFRLTTFFDLYGLPEGFPGLREHRALRDTERRCKELEMSLEADIGDRRLLPYLQRHEFEALVLAHLDGLEKLLDAAEDLRGLDALRREVAGIPPEEVDDGRNTSPSHRLARHVPSYRKTVHGPLVVEDAGLGRLCAACPRFGGWIRRLEALGSGG